MSIADLHNPTQLAPAPQPETPALTIQSEALRLTSLKDNITCRLDVYFDVLKTNNVTMATPLVDPEGFPRADIDVAGVRTARSQINRLRNDLKAVMDEMSRLLERGLPRVAPEPAGAEAAAVEEVDETKTQFAKVDGVFPNSPAASAGLQRGDQVVSIGHVNATNHDSLKGLAALVGKSEGVVLPLVILRGEEGSVLHLRLTPRSGWGGRGLLGRPRLVRRCMSQILNSKTYDPFADVGEEVTTTTETVEVKKTALNANHIHIRIQQRNGRKTITTLQGVPTEYDPKKLLKAFKKEFACNGSLVDDDEMGQVIQLQGDQRTKIMGMLLEEGISKETIKLHGF